MASILSYCGADLAFSNPFSYVEEASPPTHEERLAVVKQKYNLTDEKITEFQNIFYKFHIDGNEILDNMEIRNVLHFMKQDVTDGELQKFIAEADKDKNGYIDFPEFVEIAAKKTIASERERGYLRTFQTLDKDGNGYLSEEELKYGISGLSEKINCEPEDITELLLEVNMNSKGELNYSDFVKVLRYKSLLY